MRHKNQGHDAHKQHCAPGAHRAPSLGRSPSQDVLLCALPPLLHRISFGLRLLIYLTVERAKSDIPATTRPESLGTFTRYTDHWCVSRSRASPLSATVHAACIPIRRPSASAHHAYLYRLSSIPTPLRNWHEHPGTARSLISITEEASDSNRCGSLSRTQVAPIPRATREIALLACYPRTLPSLTHTIHHTAQPTAKPQGCQWATYCHQLSTRSCGAASPQTHFSASLPRVCLPSPLLRRRRFWQCVSVDDRDIAPILARPVKDHHHMLAYHQERHIRGLRVTKGD